MLDMRTEHCTEKKHTCKRIKYSTFYKKYIKNFVITAETQEYFV